MTAEEWYLLLNRMVFLWVTRERVDTLLCARAYRSREHLVIAVESGRLIADHADTVRLSPINSGSTIYNPQPRGRATFLPFAEYPYEERFRLRGRRNAVAEIAADYAVPNFATYVLEATVQTAGNGRIETLRTLYNR
jgi:hypothetical protein